MLSRSIRTSYLSFHVRLILCAINMTDNKRKSPIVTEGDAMVNTINALGDISHVATRLCSSIEHLHTFVSKNVSNPTQKRIILKQIKLINRGTIFVAEKMYYVTAQSSLRSVTRRTKSRQMAASNL